MPHPTCPESLFGAPTVKPNLPTGAMSGYRDAWGIQRLIASDRQSLHPRQTPTCPAGPCCDHHARHDAPVGPSHLRSTDGKLLVMGQQRDPVVGPVNSWS